MAEPKPLRPTLRTIAEISGFAVATVSRALNDAPDIGEKTKARVRQIAQEVGYVPDRAGVRLRTGKTNVISMVLSTESGIADHTGKLVSSIAQSLQKTRYHLIVTPYDPAKDTMLPVRYLVETASADAVILNRIEVEDPRVAYLMERGFPFITYGRSAWCADHPYLDFDNTAFGRIAIESLIADGRRQPALLPPPLAQSYATHMIDGAHRAAQAEGLDLTVLETANSDCDDQVMQDAVLALIEARPDIDALICPSSSSAIAAVVGIERAGRVLGRDIDVFAKEAVPFLHYFRRQIKTVYEDVGKAGGFLAQGAIQAIEAPRKPPRQKVITAGPLPPEPGA